MAPRLDLQNLFESMCDNVYFQPPENLKMQFPAIVYSPDYEFRRHANNDTYTLVDRYLVTIIDSDPDSDLRSIVRLLPRCTFARAFRTEGLNHFNYSLYY